MKKGLLVLNSIFAITLAWALVCLLWLDDYSFGRSKVLVTFVPVFIFGFFAIPINVAELFVWVKKNNFFKKIFSVLDKASGILLPIVDFFYLPLFAIIFVPISFEINHCLVEKNHSASCAYYFYGGDFVLGLFCFMIFLWLSALLLSWNISLVKKDKKFLLAIAAVFIALVSIFLFLDFSNRRSKEFEKISNESENVYSSQVCSIKTVPSVKEEKCASTPDYGISPENGTFFIYQTKCWIEPSCSAGEHPVVFNYYLRDVDGNFSRKLFTSTNEVGVVEYDIFGLAKSGEGFFARDVSGNYYSIDFFGTVTEIEKQEDLELYEAKFENDSFLIASPDGTKLAKMVYTDDNRDPKDVLEVVDIKTGEKNTYKPPKNPWNRVVLDSWSLDGRYLYLTGGIYEFSAPAKLWRFDIRTGNFFSYDKINKFVWPVFVSPENNIALVRDNDWFGSETYVGKKTKLYALNLITGNVSKIDEREGYLGQFLSSDTEDDNFYYTTGVESGDSCSADVYTVDLEKKSSSLLKKGLCVLSFEHTQAGRHFFVYKEQESTTTLLSYADQMDKEISLGESNPNNCNNFVIGKEYFDTILTGLSEGQVWN